MAMLSMENWNKPSSSVEEETHQGQSYIAKDGRVHSLDHSGNMIKRLHEMFIAEEHSDVTLVTDTSTFKAHKLILAADSDYFNAMFSTTCSETLNSVVSFKDNPDVTSAGLSAILEYAYSGSFQVTDDSVRDILAAARHFLIADVTKLCELYLLDMKLTMDNVTILSETARHFELEKALRASERFVFEENITTENYLVHLQFALARPHESILDKVINFMYSRQIDLLNCQELLKLVDTPTKLISVLKSDTHGFRTNMMTLIEFIVKWALTDIEERLPVLADIIAAVNLLYFDEVSLDAIADMQLIREDRNCKDMISEAKVFLREIQTDETEQDDAFVVKINEGCLELDNVVNESVIKGGYSLQIIPELWDNSCTLSNTRIISLGNIIALMFTGTMWSYDPSRNVWKKLADPANYQGEVTTAFLDDELCVIGKTGELAETQMHIYSLKEDLWRNGPSFPFLTNYMLAVASDLGLYVLRYDNRRRRHFMRYNPQEYQWERKADPLGLGHILLPNQNCIFLMQDEPDYLIANRYDPNADQWTIINTQHSFRYLTLQAGSLHMGVMYVVGQYDADTFSGLPNKMIALFKFDGDSGKLEKVKDDIMPVLYRTMGSHLPIVNIPKRSIAKFFKTSNQ